MDSSSVDRVEIYNAADGWRWRALGANNEPLAHGEAYTRQADAKRAVQDMYGPDVKIVDREG